MSMDIERVISLSTGIAVSNTVADATLIPLGPSAGGMIHVVSTSTNGAITVEFHVRFAPGSAEFKLYDSANALITRTIQPNRCYALPDELFAAMQFKLVATTAATGVVTISFKG